jgi:hypothetical protein
MLMVDRDFKAAAAILLEGVRMFSLHILLSLFFCDVYSLSPFFVLTYIYFRLRHLLALNCAPMRLSFTGLSLPTCSS